MPGPVLNIEDARRAPFAPAGGSELFAAELASMGAAIGACQLGCTLTVVEPGKRAFPFHNHHGNEEMFVVFRGTGEVRIGGETHPIRSGDVIACPAGGSETAHQIVNSGDEPLTYLAISTKKSPEVVEYPDSGKFAAHALGKGTNFATADVRYVGRTENSLNYWEGET